MCRLLVFVDGFVQEDVVNLGSVGFVVLQEAPRRVSNPGRSSDVAFRYGRWFRYLGFRLLHVDDFAAVVASLWLDAPWDGHVVVRTGERFSCVLFWLCRLVGRGSHRGSFASFWRSAPGSLRRSDLLGRAELTFILPFRARPFLVVLPAHCRKF